MQTLSPEVKQSILAAIENLNASNLDRFNAVNKIYEILDAHNISIETPGSTHKIFFSGDNYIEGIKTEDAARLLADQSYDSTSGKYSLALVNHTQLGQLLGDVDFELAINEKLEAAGLNQNQRRDIWGLDRDSLWGIASERYALSSSGDIIALTPHASATRIWTQVEFQSILNNQSVNTINGVDRTVWKNVFDHLRGTGYITPPLMFIYKAQRHELCGLGIYPVQRWVWVVDIVAPYGGNDEMIKDLKEKVFPTRKINFLKMVEGKLQAEEI